ncbi:MAG: hypothetical protein H7Z38_21665 [Rubrivivax sp.]|nr:hypothetical protein [Pyrinomonadaceae bacterium]
MSTPQSQFDLSDIAEPPPPARARRRAPVDLSDIAEDAPRPAAPKRALSSLSPSPGVDPRLDSFVNDVMAEASKRTGHTYKLGEGPRTAEQQAQKVREGNSWTYNSAHMHGRGRDVLAFDADGNYIKDGQHEAYKALGTVYGERIATAPVRVKWGVVRDGQQVDPGHFELEDGDDKPALDLSDIAEAAPDGDGPPERIEAATDRATGAALALDDPRREVRPDASQAPPQEIAPAPLPQRESFDVRTQEGRAARDERHITERKSNAFLELDVPLPSRVRDWSEATGDAAVRAGVEKFAASRGIPADYVGRWMKDNAPTGYSMRDRDGRETTPAEMIGPDTYDPKARTLRIKLSASHLSKLEDDYKQSLVETSRLPPGFEAARQFVTDDETSPGEKMLAVAAPVVQKAARGLDLATRPLQAIDAGFWAHARGANDVLALKTAYDEFFGDDPELGKSFIAEALKNSDRLKAINPRLPTLLGELANMIVQPSNLIPVGAAAKLLRRGEGGSALGRLAGRVGEGAREVGLLDRGFVSPRPLGVEAAEVSAKVAGDVAESELLTYARARVRAYEAEAAAAANPVKKQNALALAEDYRREVARLEAGEPLNANHTDAAELSGTEPRPDVAAGDVPPVPEKPETLRAQLNALIEGKRAVVHVTPGERVVVPNGFKSFKDFEGGRIIYDPRQVTHDEVVAAMDNGTLGELMGHVTPKAEADGVVVAARDARTGTELQASYANPETAGAQADAFASQYPGARVEVGGADLEGRLLAERQAVGDTAPPPADDGKPLHEFLADLTGKPPEPPPVAANQPSLLRRAGRTAVDVVQLPKAKAGFDLSATGRQGLAQILAHPTYFKQAMSRQVRAFASEDAATAFAESIRSRPDFDLLRENVDLSSVGDIREEPFASGLAKKIPGVRASERAYSAAMDSVRVQAWDNYTRHVADNPNVNADTYKAIGELINITTGRGRVAILDRSELGRKVVNALNVPFFSPRNTAAKFNLISPVRVVRNALDPATRPVAWLQMRDASRGLAVFSTTLGLMSYAGLDVGLNPFKPDFGKLRVGKAVYDLTGGEGATVRYLAQMAHLFSDIERGRKTKQSPARLTARYLRSQLQPAAAVAADKATGKTFDGKPFTYSQAAADLVVPFVVADAYKGWVAAGGSTIEEIDDAGTRGDFLRGDFSKVKTGFAGGASALPAVLGVGVNYYEKPEDYEAEEASRQPVPTGAVAEEARRLKLVVPPLPKTISTVGLTGDSVKLHTKGGEQLAGLSDEDYAKVKADYAAEILGVLDETIANPDYQSFESDADKKAYLDFMLKGTLERFLDGQRLRLREREGDELKKLEETQRRLEGRSRQPKPGERVKF